MGKKFSDFSDRLVHAWNVFRNKDPTYNRSGYRSYNTRPWIHYSNSSSDKSIAGAVYNRIALDVADVAIRHVRTGDNEKFKEYIPNSKLDYIFHVQANKDQTARAFMQDLVLTLFNKGVVAIVPTNTSANPRITEAFEIHTVRVGEVLEYNSDEVKVNVYNDNTGNMEEVWMLKRSVAIIQNPFYTIMNEPNSVGQRLIRKLSVLDYIDDDIVGGRWNMLIKMPYAVKRELRKEHARKRVEELQDQLKNNPLGIAYVDSTEQITQLNRPLDSNILSQVEFLQKMFFAQLGITEEVLNGSADEETMTNYYNRSVAPVVQAIVDAISTKFITKTARSQHQTMMYFRDPFKLLSPSRMADVADKYTRNEILSTNEVRSSLGYVPSDDPRADELLNKNINHPDDTQAPTTKTGGEISK